MLVMRSVPGFQAGDLVEGQGPPERQRPLTGAGQ